MKLSIFEKVSREERPVPHLEVDNDPVTMTPDDLERVTKTDRVLVDPRVVAMLFTWGAFHRHNEVGYLLLGRIDGRYLVIEDAVRAERVGTATTVTFTPADFDRAQAEAKGNLMVVGWAHTHPTFGVFMSATDVRFQTQGQQLFPDYVALVLDPFRRNGADFRFFRLADGNPVELPHGYLRRGNAA